MAGDVTASLIGLRSALLAGVILSGHPGCAKTVVPPGSVASESGLTVATVSVIGNREVSDGAIIGGLALRPPIGWLSVTRTSYDPITLELDRRRIEAFYRRRGFFSADVTRAEAREDGDVVHITYQVREGNRTSVVRLGVAGAAGLEGLRRDELLDVSGLDLGEPMVYDDYEEATRRVKEHLVATGYAFADVSGAVEVDRGDHRASVAFIVDAGPRVRFGETRVRGNDTIPTETVLDRVVWEEGEIFSPSLVAETRSLLYELGHFNVVRFDMDREERPEVADVELRVAEGTKHAVRLGFGVGLDRARYEARGRAGYTERGFLDPLITLNLEARPSYSFLRGTEGTAGIGGEASARLEKEDFLWSRLSLGNELAYAVQDFQAYSVQGPLYEISLARPFLADDLHVGISWQIRYQNFFRIADGIDGPMQAELGLLEPYRLGAFSQSVIYDRRDDPLDARNGYYAGVRLEESGTYSGSRFEYLLVVPDLRAYFSPWERLVLAARARYGRTVFDRGVLPITQRFFAGGAASHRGFAFQRLSPLVDDGEGRTVPVGGEAILESSGEVRYDVTRLWDNWLGIAAFVDAGDVTTGPGGIEANNLHWAAGLGLRYRTIIGPLRFDVGYRLNRKGADDPDPDEPFAVHLSLGEAF